MESKGNLQREKKQRAKKTQGKIKFTTTTTEKKVKSQKETERKMKSQTTTGLKHTLVQKCARDR